MNTKKVQRKTTFTSSGEKDKKTSSGSKKEQVKGVESRQSILVPSDKVAQRHHTAASEKGEKDKYCGLGLYARFVKPDVSSTEAYNLFLFLAKYIYNFHRV